MKIIALIITFWGFTSCSLLSERSHLKVYLPEDSNGWGAIVYLDTAKSRTVVVNHALIGTTNMTFNKLVSKNCVFEYEFYMLSKKDTILLVIGENKNDPNTINSIFLRRITLSNNSKPFTIVQFHVGKMVEENVEAKNSSFGLFDDKLNNFLSQINDLN